VSGMGTEIGAKALGDEKSQPRFYGVSDELCVTGV